jgi:general secretion pathway protein L
MKFDVLPLAGKYFNWWTSTLKSCVPSQAQSLFKKYNTDVELIIRHQANGVFLQDNHGRVIDSISADSDVENVSDNNELDFDLGGDTKVEENTDTEIDSTHIDLSRHAEVIHHEFNKKEPDLSDYTLDQIDLTDRNDTTLVFSRDDKTTRMMALMEEDDTLVIQDDQGTLLNFKAEQDKERDSTVLYYSDRGKIRAIDPKKDLQPEQDVDINLGVENAGREDSCIEFNLAASLLDKNPGNKKCLYLIPDEKVFSLVLNYPIETLENIENVLRYDLEKHIPLNFQEIRFFYALNILSTKGKVDVEIIVIKSTVYDLLIAAFESENQREIICTTRHFYEHYGTKINILGGRVDNKPRSMLNVANVHMAINFLLLAVLLVLPYQMSYQKLDAIQPKTRAEISKAGEIVSTINQLNAEIELGKKLNAQISKEHRVVELLARLSESIATDAWISRFTYKNGEIKLKGEAFSATSVSDDLNDMGIFESIKFTSSIIKIPNTNKETFELALKLKTDA